METNTSGDDLFVDQLLNLDNHDDDDDDDDDDDIVHHLEPAPAPPLPAKQKHYHTISPLHHLQDDSLLSVPEQQADLEWLSYFVEDSFSHFTTPYPPSFLNPNPNPKARRTKRARTGGRVWSAQQTTTNKLTSSAGSGSLSLRRCSHCGVQKTPQWRGGPQGPKTLCNACGVRYKSGRLLPEYRPACSPTFSSELHSNSHRKVLEMRKNKHIRLPDSGHPLSTSNTSLLS